ncbi:MAG: hypothetical protein AVDCRST_MAG83-3389, partial [uncultured Arthrobacter sp.]
EPVGGRPVRPHPRGALRRRPQARRAVLAQARHIHGLL